MGVDAPWRSDPDSAHWSCHADEVRWLLTLLLKGPGIRSGDTMVGSADVGGLRRECRGGYSPKCVWAGREEERGTLPKTEQAGSEDKRIFP